MNEMTLAEAKTWMREHIDEGTHCLCCTQFAKIYKRNVNATMARSLIALYRAYGREFGSLPDLRRKVGLHHSNQEATMAYWKLIEEEPTVREDGGRAGFWRVTDLGERWILRQTTIPKYARVYDGRCLGHRGDPVTIIDALGERFNYWELMRR